MIEFSKCHGADSYDWTSGGREDAGLCAAWYQTLVQGTSSYSLYINHLPILSSGCYAQLIQQHTSVRVCPHSTYFFALTAVTPALKPIQMRKVRVERGEQKMRVTRNKESRRCISGCQMLRAYHSLSLLAYCLPLPRGLGVWKTRSADAEAGPSSTANMRCEKL